MAFATLAQKRVGALGVDIDPFLITRPATSTRRTCGAPRAACDLPLREFATRALKVELVINLEVARTLGLTIPLSLPGRAAEVIG